MKKSEVKELTAKSDLELGKMVTDIRAELSKIYVEIKSRRLINVALIGKKKKDIARILTELNARKHLKEEV